jgi:hypothetical protein
LGILYELSKVSLKAVSLHNGNKFRSVPLAGAVHVVGPVGRPARPRELHDYHHDTKVKQEAATAVIALLMMGGKTPETC